MDKWRTQLWAEGLALYRDGKRANLPRDLMDLQAKHGERHRRKDSIIEDAVAKISTDGPMTIKEVCSHTGTETANQRRLADALRSAGWTNKQERVPNGARVYLWRR